MSLVKNKKKKTEPLIDMWGEQWKTGKLCMKIAAWTTQEELKVRNIRQVRRVALQ